jgi:hypothetical protein
LNQCSGYAIQSVVGSGFWIAIDFGASSPSTMCRKVMIENPTANEIECWAALYGHGHQDPGHDDRLFSLNRKRDARRAGHQALEKALAFVWSGELSRYDPETDGFPVALGPKLVKTAWGVVRFKPEEAPGNLSVRTDVIRREQWRRQIEEGRQVEIDVVMTGKLIPEESIVYDFSHDEEGLGLIMPFVRVERVELVLIQR